jgi:hypothetical protein
MPESATPIVVRPSYVNITRREVGALVRLLRTLQVYLESSIHCAVLPGTGEVNEASDADQLQQDRLDWRAAEDMRIRLCKAIGGDAPIQSCAGPTGI